MSLAVLARKTKTKQRLKSTTCGNGRSRSGQQGRSVGFVLNMTGRGGGIGLSGMSYKQRGASCRNKQPVPCGCKGCCSGNCKTGQAGTCCKADNIVSQERRANCGECWYGGMSQPAPQMSYRNYINRKASGAYRPGGRPCCDPKCYDINYGEDSPYVNPNKNPNTWKQPPNISSSEITEHRKQATIRSANGLIKRNPVYLGKTLLSNRINAKPVCSWYNPETCKYETVKGPNPLTQSCQRTTTLPIKSRLGYTRINKNWCNTTKSLTVSTSSSDQIAKRKQRAFKCINNGCCNTCVFCESPAIGTDNVINLGVSIIEINDSSDAQGTGIYEIILLNGPSTLCRCGRIFKMDVSNLTSETYYITTVLPSIGNGAFLEDPLRPGYYLYSQVAFENYLNNNPTFNVIRFQGGGNNKITFKIPSYICKNDTNDKFLYLINTSQGTPIDTFNDVTHGFIPLYFNLICRDRNTCNKLQNRYCYTYPNQSSARKICDTKLKNVEKIGFNFKCFKKIGDENYLSAGQPNSWPPGPSGFQQTFIPKYYCGYGVPNDPRTTCVDINPPFTTVSTGLWHGFASFNEIDTGSFNFNSYWRLKSPPLTFVGGTEPGTEIVSRVSNSPDFKLKLRPGQVPRVPAGNPFWFKPDGSKNQKMTTYTILSLNNSWPAISPNIAQIPTNGTELSSGFGKPFNKDVFFTGKIYEYTLDSDYDIHVFVKKIKTNTTPGEPSYIDEFNNAYTYKLSNLSENSVFTIGVPASEFPTWTDNTISYGTEKYFIWVGFMIEGPWLKPGEKDDKGHVIVGLCQ